MTESDQVVVDFGKILKQVINRPVNRALDNWGFLRLNEAFSDAVGAVYQLFLQPEAALQLMEIIEASDLDDLQLDILENQLKKAKSLLSSVRVKPDNSSIGTVSVDKSYRIVGVEGRQDLLKICFRTIAEFEQLDFADAIEADPIDLFRGLGRGDHRFYPIRLPKKNRVLTLAIFRGENGKPSSQPLSEYLVAVLEDKAWSPELGAGMSSFKLTPSEVNIVQQVRASERLPAMAERLDLSVNTVRTHLKSVFSKLGLANQAELIQFRQEAARLASVVETRLSPNRSHQPRNYPSEQYWPEREVFKLANGRSVSFRRFGLEDGPAVLCLHGAYCGSMIADGYTPLAQALGITIIAPDRPGYGESSSSNDLSVSEAAREVIELMSKLGYKSYGVLALAIGSAFGLECIRGNPAATGLVMCSPHFASAPIEETNPKLTFMTDHETTTRAPWLLDEGVRSAMNNLTPETASSLAKEIWKESPWDHDLVNNTNLHEYFGNVTVDAMHVPFDGPLWELEALAKYRFSLEGINRPIVLAHGAKDMITNYDGVISLFENYSEFSDHVFENSGHLFFHTDWADVLRLATSFGDE